MFTFPMSGIWQVVHVAEQLHEVAPQSRHDVRRIPASQAPHHPYGQSPHHPRLIIQCHKQRPQTAHTHRHTHQAQLRLWRATAWLQKRPASYSKLKTATRKILTPPPPILSPAPPPNQLCHHMQQNAELVEVLHAAALPKEHHSSCHAQTNLQHCMA